MSFFYPSPEKQISDATPAFLLLILMSLVPVDLRQFKNDRKTNPRFRPKHARFLLNWNSVIKKLQWPVVLLFGGGLALADGTNKSGLSDLFTNQLVKMNIKYPKLFIACLTIFCTFFTEIGRFHFAFELLLNYLTQYTCEYSTYTGIHFFANLFD